MSFLFTEIMNDGAFRGTLRGVTMSAIQTSLVLWPSIVLTNRNKGELTSFVSTFCILDAIMYPLDTLKNRMYAFTTNPQSNNKNYVDLRQALSNFSFGNIFGGLTAKFAFNLPFAAAIYSTAQRDENAWMYWLGTAALYPLNTLKVRFQTGVGVPSRFGLFNGLVPFLAMNMLVAWELTALSSKEKCNWLLEQANH